MKKIIFIIPVFFILTGCYNYRELNDLAIVSGVSISMNDDEYSLSVEVVNPKKGQDTTDANEPDYVIYTESDISIQKAFRKIVNTSPKKVYGTQMDILIIDESVALENLTGLLDFFAREPEVRSEFYVLISQNENTLEATSPLINLSSKKIISSMDANNEVLGITNLVTYHDLISNYLNPNIELALPSIKTINQTKESASISNTEKTDDYTTTELSTIAVFKDNKLLGYLTESESVIYNLVMNNTSDTLFKIDYNSKEFIINEVIDTNSSIKVDIENNEVIISIDGNASISEVSYNCNLEDDKIIKQIEDDLNKEIEKEISNNINSIIDKYNSDIFGFLDIYYKDNPNNYKNIYSTWYDNYFNKLKINVKSNVKIHEKGNLNGGIYE